ncbi:OmpA family protein [Geomobilimonas luticola]|uniref:OmpA family protein n=1 Tax=Geomobilimonas luticola TaxID=1114878 RepID=A0ABS5SFZ5_9BACT|nr:OmpA family protein [Geomobilimonas luticola]MBT0654288.1 OmpA family protein [Geomobilimonas luticola]
MRTQICMFMMLATLAGCAQPMTKTQKGAAIGTGAGAAAGAALGQAIGRDTGSTLIGAAVGAAVGGVTGGFIGNYMDKQEEAMRQTLSNVEGANVQRNLDTLAVTFKSDILFAVNSSTLKGGAFDEISRVAKVLNQYPETRMTVAGYTDSTGSEELNQKLSEKRAESVKNALVGEGVNPARITTVGYGESKPVADNDTEAGRQLNRRVTIFITPNQQ